MSKKTEMIKAEKNKKKKIVWCIVGILFLAFIVWVILLNKDGNKLNYTTSEKDGKTVYTIENDSYVESEEESDLVLIEVEKNGIMIAELYPSVAPITVKNFKKLIKEGFYSNLTFHRVIKDFMIQTGDPTATGTGGSDETIKGEFEINGIKNDLKHTRGVLSMARAGSTPETEYTLNSASSQFFIVHKDNANSEYLDGKYAAFGKLLHGYDVLDKVATTQTDENDKPLVDQVLKKIIFVNKYEGEK